LIDSQNDKITDLRAELETLRQQGISNGNLPADFAATDSDEEPEITTQSKNDLLKNRNMMINNQLYLKI